MKPLQQRTQPYQIYQEGTHVSRYYQLRSTDTDARDRMTLETLFALLQELAYDSIEHLGIPQQQVDEKGICWMLARLSLSIEKWPKWRDPVGIETWIRQVDGLYFHRDFLVYDAAGQVIARALSAWFLADRQSHKPLRCDALVAEPSALLGCSLPAIAHLKRAKRMRYQRLSLAGIETTQRLIRYSDIDRNGHLNNTKYIAIAMDAFYASLGGCADQPREVHIQYVAEVKVNQCLEIAVLAPRPVPECPDDLLYPVIGLVDDQLVFMSEIEVSRLDFDQDWSHLNPGTVL